MSKENSLAERVRLKHVQTYRSGGKVYHYHRKTGERLPDHKAKRRRRVLEINQGLRRGTDQAEKQQIEWLKRDNADLQGTIQDLRKTIGDLHKRIKSAETQKQHFNFATDAEDALLRPDAYRPWEAPMPAPRRLRGVYRLIKEGRTVYIGQSVDIISRVLVHVAEKDFDQFSYALVDGGRETLNDIEAALIILERPPENSLATVPKFSREEAQAILNEYRCTAADAGKDAA